MPFWNSPRENALYNVHGILDKLAARGVELPESVTASAATLDRIETTRPEQPPADAIRRAILADADPAHIDALVLTELGHSRLAADHRQAQIDAAVAVLAAIRADHDHSIFAQLK